MWFGTTFLHWVVQMVLHYLLLTANHCSQRLAKLLAKVQLAEYYAIVDVDAPEQLLRTKLGILGYFLVEH